ncbi:hypothetical protein BDF19DRAFT_449250 [Syncephalis fuscata]|nr:hypothetical protein BDF19DRAFT_449250 [Syncephalis fuscata]
MSAETGRKPIRIWVDGCFDMMHYGHANALRQAKEMGDYLVVGVHSDAEILLNKGPTVMKEEERYAAVEACKWVDEVVRDAPYVTSLDYLDRYNCDFCVHGDDITTAADGSDCYQEVKDAGRYRECKRTQGVSTTELVGRMLLMTRSGSAPISGVGSDELGTFVSGGKKTETRTSVSHFLPTSRRIVQFSDDSGHIEFLKRAKALGDYLLVGVHDDKTINQIKGSNYPLMNLHERVLSVLACRYVDEVIIGAPYSVTQDVLEKVAIVNIVGHGIAPAVPDIDGRDPYELPKKLGIYQEIVHTGENIHTREIIRRIIEQRQL